MNCYEGGYVDQLRGACKEAMLVGEGRDASAYRAGARTCRADLAAEADAKNPSDTRSHEQRRPDPDYVAPMPDWARRLTEFRKMAGMDNPFMRPEDAPAQEKEPEVFHSLYMQEPMKPAEKQLLDVRADNLKEISKIMGVPEHVARPNAFAEPVPGAKKAKKPKPVDADQTSFL